MNSSAGLFSRGEWETPVQSIEPQVDHLERTPAGDVGAKNLRPIVRSEVERTTWRSNRGDSILEFAFDDGQLKADDRKAPVCELEIELLKGDAAAAFEVARGLAEDIPVRIGVLSKAERGFALADGALGKVAKAGPVAVRAEMEVADGFILIAHSCIRHFRLNEPITVEKRDADALHQTRVAMRRLRAALSVFRPALEDRQFEALRGELRWFTAQLGEARNLDVYLEQKGIPADVRKALKKKRRLAYDRVAKAVGSKRFRLLMIDLVAWISLGQWHENEKAKRPLADFATRRIGRLWQKVASHGELEPMGDEERHELRIEVKKLRYALEFVEPLHAGAGGRQKRFSRAVEALQDALGVLNDLATARTIARMVGDVRGIARAESEEVRATCLHEAQVCLDRLRKIGPYWNKVGRGAPNSTARRPSHLPLSDALHESRDARTS